jgi:hypothetical protein
MRQAATRAAAAAEKLRGDRDEMPRVVGHQSSAFIAGGLEQVPVCGAHEVGALGDGDDVVSTIAKALGDGGAVVLVEPQPQPTAARRRSSRRCTRWAAASCSAA